MDGTFLGAVDLLEVYAKTLESRLGKDIILMCGSGVTACHNILALELAGVYGAKLYAGSWSEWIRDPQRPIVKE